MQIVINEEQVVSALQRVVMADIQNRDGTFAREVYTAMREVLRSNEFSELVKNTIFDMLPGVAAKLATEQIETAIKNKAVSVLRRMAESGEMADILREVLKGKS